MRKNKWCVIVQEATGVGLAILFYCGVPVDPAAADRQTASIVLSIAELDLVTAGAAYVAVSATGSAVGADNVATVRTTAGASEAVAISGGRSTGSANATGSSTARSRDGTVATASDNQVLVQGDGGGAGIRLVTNARAAGDSVSAWSGTWTEAENGTQKDVASGVARSRSTGDSADASAQIFFPVIGEPTSTKSWTESKDLPNGTVTTSHENVVYVSDGIIIRTWKTIRDVDKANGSNIVATGKMVTVQNGHRSYAGS